MERKSVEQLPPIAVALDSILELARTGELLRRIARLTELLEGFGPTAEPNSDVPKETRSGISRIAML